MAEDFRVDVQLSKDEQYVQLLLQLQSLWGGERHWVALLANTAAALHGVFGWHWVGFYTVHSSDELVLGPFQGPVACFRIKKHRGVCGAAWRAGQTVLVPDVEAFEGHIACSSLSRSEVVVPVRNARGEIVAVLDADSTELAGFDECDARHLQSICDQLGLLYEG